MVNIRNNTINRIAKSLQEKRGTRCEYTESFPVNEEYSETHFCPNLCECRFCDPYYYDSEDYSDEICDIEEDMDRYLVSSEGIW